LAIAVSTKSCQPSLANQVSPIKCDLDLVRRVGYPTRARYLVPAMKRRDAASTVRSSSALPLRSHHGSLQTQGISLPRLGLGTFRLQAIPAARRSKARWRSAIAISTPLKCTATKSPSELRSRLRHRAPGSARHHQVWHENLAPMRSAGRSTQPQQAEARSRRLYLVHWPSNSMNLSAVFETLIEAQRRAPHPRHRRRQFHVALLKTVVEEIKAPIACNQIEYHVMLDQTKVAKYLAPNRSAGGLLPAGAGPRRTDETLIAIGRKHDASAAQVALEVAARSGRRCGDPEGVTRGKPAGQPRRAESEARRSGPKTIAALPRTSAL